MFTKKLISSEYSMFPYFIIILLSFINLLIILYYQYKDAFKNSFDELEEDQMINISEINEVYTETTNKRNNKPYAPKK